MKRTLGLVACVSVLTVSGFAHAAVGYFQRDGYLRTDFTAIASGSLAGEPFTDEPISFAADILLADIKIIEMAPNETRYLIQEPLVNINLGINPTQTQMLTYEYTLENSADAIGFDLGILNESPKGVTSALNLIFFDLYDDLDEIGILSSFATVPALSFSGFDEFSVMTSAGELKLQELPTDAFYNQVVTPIPATLPLAFAAAGALIWLRQRQRSLIRS